MNNNPLLAEPMYLTQYIERMGTGIRDMIQRCRKAELPEPEFRIDGGIFVLTIWRKTSRQVEVFEAQSGAQSDEILLQLKMVPLSAGKIAFSIGLKSKSGAFKRSLQELLNKGLIEYTIPENPGSRLQKYRLTAKEHKALKIDQ